MHASVACYVSSGGAFKRDSGGAVGAQDHPSLCQHWEGAGGVDWGGGGGSTTLRPNAPGLPATCLRLCKETHS